MATIKGQNLRLFLDGQAIACALTCNLHCSAETGDTSTKDDDDSLWALNEVTKLNWDVSGDGLCSLGGGSKSGTVSATGTTNYIVSGSYTCYRADTLLSLSAGQTITVTPSGSLAVEYIIIADASKNILAQGSGSASYTATSSKNVYIYIAGMTAKTRTVNYTISGGSNTYTFEDLLDMIAAKTVLECHFSTSSGTSETDDFQWGGDVLLTDVQITAQNGENSQYSFSCVGVGELSDLNQ